LASSGREQRQDHAADDDYPLAMPDVAGDTWRKKIAAHWHVMMEVAGLNGGT
jgi:hypothetical protein